MPSLRVATFNLLHGMSLRDRVADPDRLTQAARVLDADLLGLQEVDRNQPRSGGADQTELAAHALEARWWRFVPSLHGTPGDGTPWTASTLADGTGSDGPSYGVGLVSRLPVTSWSVHRFDPAPFAMPLLVPGDGAKPRFVRVDDEPRVALAAVVEGPHGPFTAVTTHLSFVPGYNVQQLRRIVQWTADLPAPVLLLGDFNLPGALPRWVSGWTGLVTGATYPSWQPRVQFDHVLARGLSAERVRRRQVLPLEVSDHCAVTVDLAV